jgi:hypothetical protein
MPVYHFTVHAYRSWNADHPRGYRQRGEAGTLRPSASLGYVRDRLAKHPPVEFDRDDQKFLITATQEAVARRRWKLYGVTVIEGHLHAVVGWEDSAISEDMIQAGLKRGLGFLLSQRFGTRGKPYFSRGGSPERVLNRKHLHFLLTEYLPKHRGPFWVDENILEGLNCRFGR